MTFAVRVLPPVFLAPFGLITAFLAALFSAILAFSAMAQETPEPSEPPMTFARMGAIVQAIDPNAQVFETGFQLTIEDIPVIIVSDPTADRMRAMVPIRSVEGLEAAELMRLMQANFDTALDARYAVANGRLWGAFIHPLSPLQREQLISGLIQTVNLARTYGTLYSGGAQTFGAGDSNALYQQLFSELLRKGEDI